MKCPRCGNEDSNYFYQDQQGYYCRRCIGFGRINIDEKMKIKEWQSCQKNVTYQLAYELTQNQQSIAEKVIAHIENHKDVFVYAACGAGKTEIMFPLITKCMKEGKKIGFAISRRQVVLEICERMKDAFPTLKVVPVCQGYTKEVDGDLIICTMHQLYRYYQAFDILIMDEVDAFPYANNSLLATIAKQACKDNFIYLSATLNKEIQYKLAAQEMECVELFERPHGFPLIEPNIYKMPLYIQWLWLFFYLKKQHRQQILIFVPTIAYAKRLWSVLKLSFKIGMITSKTENKDILITKFKEKHYLFLIATTILERGITIKGIDVIIMSGEHVIFNEASIIQMIGRVGRSFEKPQGSGIILCTQRTKYILEAQRVIEKMNQK